MVGWGDFAGKVRALADANGLKTVVFVGRGLTASMIYELRDSGLDIRSYVEDRKRAGRPFRDDAALEPGRPWPGAAGLCRRRRRPPRVAARATLVEQFKT